MAKTATAPKKQDHEFTFQAALSSWRVDGSGEAKLTLQISKTEALKMAQLSQYDNRLFQVAIIVLPETEIPDDANVEDEKE